MSVEAVFSRRSFRSPGSPTRPCDSAAGGGGTGQQSPYGQSGSQDAARLAHHCADLVEYEATAQRGAA